MKVYTKIVMDMDSFDLVEEQSYEYDGPVAEAKGVQEGGSAAIDPLNLFGGRQAPGAEEKQTTATAGLGQFGSNVEQYTNWLNQNTPGVMAQFQPGTPQENQLFNLESGRYLDKLLPQLAGSGILTSGVGLNAVSHGLSDFTTQFESERLKQQLNALLGIGGLQQAPMGAWGGALSPLFGATNQSTLPGGGVNIAGYGVKGA